MNVFLIYVEDENYYQLLPERLNKENSGGNRVKVMGFPPLGIQTIAPVLRQKGHKVSMFDTCHPQMKIPNIVQAAQKENPDLIALSFLSTTTYPNTKAMSQQLKKVVPNIPIIVGGPFATMNSDHILLDCPDIDAVGVGEGEELIPDYLNNLKTPGNVLGLVWRDGDKIVENAPRPLQWDLDQFPYPDRTGLPIDFIESLPLDIPAVLSLDKFCTMQTSRGCPYPCVYCDIPSLSNSKWRSRSPEHVLGEMQELSDQGYRTIYLTDDHFLLKRKRIQDICNGMIERKLKFKWGCEGRVDSIAVDQLANMSKAKCALLMYGIESGSQKTLDRLKKHQTLAQIENAVELAKKNGIERVHGFFLIGSPDESENDIMDSFRFAARLKLDTFGFNRLCAYRGTPLWTEYVNRGIIDDEKDWNKWFKCSDIDPTILPSEKLNSIRMKGYGLLFFKRFFFRPILTFKLLRQFSRYMKTTDIMKLFYSPFRKRSLSRKPDLPVKMLDLGLQAPIRSSN